MSSSSSSSLSVGSISSSNKPPTDLTINNETYVSYIELLKANRLKNNTQQQATNNIDGGGVLIHPSAFNLANSTEVIINHTFAGGP